MKRWVAKDGAQDRKACGLVYEEQGLAPLDVLGRLTQSLDACPAARAFWPRLVSVLNST